MRKHSRRVKICYEAMASEDTVVTVEDFNTTITKYVDVIQLKPSPQVWEGNLLSWNGLGN